MNLKKRLLSLVLALATLVSIIPGNLIVFANDVAAISIDEMEVGKLYRAVWNYDKYPDVSPCKYVENAENEDESLVSYGYYIMKNTFPQELFVKKLREGDSYVYVTNEDWGTTDSGTLKEAGPIDDYRYVQDCEVTVLECIEPEVPDDGLIRDKVDLKMDGETVSQIVLDKGEKTYVFTELDAEINDATAKYQWQICIDSAENRWATIGDYIYPYAALSEALLVNAPDGVAKLRCIVSDGETQYVSGEITVTSLANSQFLQVFNADDLGAATSGYALDRLSSTETDAGVAPAAGDDAFQVTINYVFARKNEDNKHENAATPFTQSLSGTQVCNGVFDSPFVIGYIACVPVSYETDINFEGQYYIPQPSWEFKNVGIKSPVEDRNITIYYVPQKTNFVVEHYYQNLDDDGYSLAGMDVNKTKYTDDPVGKDLARNAYGYTPLFYDATTKVAGNGNTVIEIYYDRVYYLVNFNLQDGYGLMPYYVRYETQVMLTEPTRPGYSFVNPWELTRVYTKKNDDDKGGTDLNKNDAEISAAYANKNANTIITVKHNLDYKANWTVGDTAYTIVYWLENTDSTDSSNKDNYDVWYTYSQNAKTGAQTIAGADNIKNYIKSGTAGTDVNNTYPYLIYQSGLTDTTPQTVEGDGSTTVNVYYSRKEYTLKFYYAMSSNGQYYVIGGSSNYFGASAVSNLSSANKGDEIKLLDQYLQYTDPKSQVGQVSEPTLNAKGQSRKYTIGSDTSVYNSSYKHHYISFTAKYGADISDLWPCDVFNSVTNQEKNTSEPQNGWRGTTAYVSAWNGEHHVKYTQDHKDGNQTVKGNYTVLDENLLWASSYGESTTVAYACFWENGAEGVKWNVPKLFRYNIYLPLLDDQDTTGLTIKTYNGARYYLATQYDTCDDSDTGGQTQPGLVGFTASGKGYDTITSFDTSVYKEAYNMYFYYSRNTYNITFNDQHGKSKTLPIAYATDLSADTYKNYVPDYPAALEEGECTFAGWYIDEACQIPFDFNTTMPAKNIQLYAKWEPKTYNVKVYRQESEKDAGSTVTGELLLDKTVEFGTQIQESELAAYVKPNEHYVFAGWFYTDENGEENRYDFNTMVVKHVYVIYAKWTKNVPIPYTVKYVTEVNGQKIEIAKADSGIALEGVKKTFTAKSGVDLTPPYHEWYFPKERYITFEMKADEAENVVEFVYETATQISYTISHVFKNEEFKTYFNDSDTFTYDTLFTISKNNNDAFQAIITEKFNDLVNEANIKDAAKKQNQSLTSDELSDVWDIVRGLTPDYYTQELHLVSNSNNNVMTFNWQDAGATTMYQVVHYIQNKGSKNTYSTFSTEGYIVQNESDTPITAKWREIPGFKRAAFKINGVTQNNDYLKKDDIETTLGGNVATQGKILELYYDRKTYTYTVHHYIVGTTNKLRDDESEEAYFEEEILTSTLEQRFDGYVYYSDNVPSHTIGTDGYEIIVFYSPMKVNFRYQEAIPGRGSLTRNEYKGAVGVSPTVDDAACTATAKDGYRFIGWFLDPNGETPVTDSNAFITDNGATIMPLTPTSDMANMTITFFAMFEPTIRVFKNKGVSAEDVKQAFVYRVKGVDTSNSNVDVTLVIVGNNSVTVAMLPFGRYMITVMDWSWRYGDPSLSLVDGNSAAELQSSDNIYNLNAVGDIVFDYSGKRSIDQWLTDEESATYSSANP